LISKTKIYYIGASCEKI